MKLATSFPLLIMFTVATSQFVIAQFLPLSPWKGGGFGMFSTIDAPQTRRVLVFLVKDGKGSRVPYRKYKDLNKSFRVLPTQQRLKSMMEQFLPRITKPFDAVVMEYWKMEFDPKRGAVQRSLIFKISKAVGKSGS